MGERKEEAKGNVKEGIGKLTGNSKMQTEGAAERDGARGTRQVKGATKQVTGSVKNAAGKFTGDDALQAEGTADRLNGDVERTG